MDLARSLGAPVPKVLRYHCTQDNAVGQPFIAFRDPGGSVISNVWMDIDDRERLKLGRVAADVLAKLSAVEFPAYGNIYYTRDLPDDCKSYPIPDRDKYPHHFALNTALKKKEGSYVSPLAHPDDVARSKQAELYEDYLKILPHLLPVIDAAMNAPRLVVDSFLPLYYFEKPLLTASRDMAIAAILDFSKFFIRPSFHQPQASTASMASNIPQMPREPGNMSSKQQELIAKQLMSWRQWMVKTTSFDTIKHVDGADAAKWGLLQELFNSIRRPFHKHNRLHCALIRVTEQWDDITRTKDGLVPPCPISYHVKEKEETLREQERLDAVRDEWRFFCAVTGTRADGAVSAHDYERANRYCSSIHDRVNANGGKYFPDVDVSDSTGETFETPDDFETVLCKRMGISRQTFWRTVVDSQPEPTFSEGASRDQPVLSAWDDLLFTPDKEEQ
ncbi:hypothetical protein SLS58_006379 [Diplodia intermedia]|uniref:Aminoglycoside phosphotransferase domain-containing protein n=1 Tax=Diplodia intermedia TaxID=856260 RepID=A0ABR3TNG8_9PEZI